MQQGFGQNLSVGLTPLNGFSGTVTLTVQGVPTAVDVSPSDQIQGGTYREPAAIPGAAGFTCLPLAEAAVGEPQ